VLAVYTTFTFVSLFVTTDSLGARLFDWKDYMLMPLLLVLTAAAVTNIQEMQLMVLLMCAAAFTMDRSFWSAISERDFSAYSTDLQEGGAMGYAGVQGLAAFNAAFAWFMIALAGSQTRRVLRWACVGLAVYAARCVMYSFSRGAYVAFLAGWLFMGIVRYRALLVVLALFIASWAAIAPPAVQQRVNMTYDENGEMDHSASVRLELWAEAVDLFRSSPILGSGFNTYAHMEHLNGYADSHNIYLKVLVETGAVGLFVFFWLLASLAWCGFRVYRTSGTPFLKSLGLGLVAWVLCAAVASCFGDRWMYLQINGYLWMIAGFIARSEELERAVVPENQPEAPSDLVPAFGL